MNTKQVIDLSSVLLQLVAENLPPHPTGDDVKTALEIALRERFGECGGLVIVWWDEINGLRINPAPHRGV